MNVFGWATDHAVDWTAPFPPTNGVKLRLLGGDLLEPNGWELKPGVEAGTPTNWFNSNPRHVLRCRAPFPCLPFVSVKLGRFGMYAGFKVYGVDSPAYTDWLPAQEVYEGSRAMCLTLRFSGSRPTA